MKKLKVLKARRNKAGYPLSRLGERPQKGTKDGVVEG